MFAVIFKAEIHELDEYYSDMSRRMKELALNEYSCIEFTSCTEDGYEIAISYWPDKEKIQAWKSNPEHRYAQELGMSKWYKSYQVQVVEVLTQYESHT